MRATGKFDKRAGHADLWERLRLGMAGPDSRVTAVRWVPAHRPEGALDISARDREGNDAADSLANAEAIRIGPSHAQQHRYDSRAALCTAIQKAQDAVLQDAQAADDGDSRGSRRNRLAGSLPAPALSRARTYQPLSPGELRTCGVHLVVRAPDGSVRCTQCQRTAGSPLTHRRMAALPCKDRRGLTRAPITLPQWERWNTAWIQRWARRDAGDPAAHDIVRYFATTWDGRFLCTRCGLHYVRSTDLVTKVCFGRPLTAQAREALEDATAGKSLKRQAVNSRAKFPSGANIGAAGRRLPGGNGHVRVEPRPLGPAHPDFQGGGPGGGGGPARGRRRPASAPPGPSGGPLRHEQAPQHQGVLCMDAATGLRVRAGTAGGNAPSTAARRRRPVSAGERDRDQPALTSFWHAAPIAGVAGSSGDRPPGSGAAGGRVPPPGGGGFSRPLSYFFPGVGRRALREPD